LNSCSYPIFSRVAFSAVEPSNTSLVAMLMSSWQFFGGASMVNAAKQGICTIFHTYRLDSDG
jgi:hypothetical protein